MENDSLYETLKAKLGDEYRVKLKDGNIIISDPNKKDFYLSIPADYKGSSIDVAYVYPGDFNQGNKRDINFSSMADVVNNIRTTNPDAMIIHSAGAQDNFKLVDITDKIMECTGMDYNNVAFEGHSAGCFGVTSAAGSYARRHPNNIPPTLIMADGYYRVSPSSLKSKDIQALNDMGATVIELSVYGKTPNSHGLERFIGNGTTVLYLDPKSKSKSGGHGSAYKHAFGTDLIGLALGNGGNFDGYDIKYTMDIYDPQTGKLVAKNVSPNEALKYLKENPYFKSKVYIQSLEYTSNANFDDFKERSNNLIALKDIDMSKLSNLYEVSSDKKYVLDNMQKIISITSSTKMLGGFWGCGTSSTTRVPVCAKDYVYNYKRMLVSLLEKISNEAIDAIGVALDIDTTDMKLKSAIDSFDDLIIPEAPILESTPTGQDSNKDKEEDKNKNKGNDKSNDSVPRHHNMPGGLPREKTSTNFSSNNQEFPDYDSIKSSDNRIVYEVNQGCKVIIDKDVNNNITNMEYYYDFGNEKNATDMLNDMKQKYFQLSGSAEVTQNGQYVKVSFNKQYCEKISLDDVLKQYSNFERV